MALGTVRGEVLGIPHLPKPGRYPEFPARTSGEEGVCAFLQGKAHEVLETHETPQEIGDMGHPSFVKGKERTIRLLKGARERYFDGCFAHAARG